MPVSRRLTRWTSIQTPVPLLLAHSTTALVMPAAPRSCIPTTASLCSASRQASMSSFSRKGLPTWTVGRWSAPVSYTHLTLPTNREV